jgi:hypothetical protein
LVVFAASTFAAAVEADSFVTTALVPRLGFGGAARLLPIRDITTDLRVSVFISFLLEVGTCPTSASDEVLPLAVEVLGTKTASTDPMTDKDQKSKKDVN